MSKLKFISVLLLSFIMYGFGQTKRIDSLIGVTQSSKIEKDKAGAYQRLAWLHIGKESEKAKQYLDSSATIYGELKDKEGLIQIAYKRAVINRFSGNYPKALEQINTFITYKTSRGDSAAVADALFQKGVILEKKGNYSKSLKAYYRALAIYETNDDLRSVANLYNSIGIVFKNFGQPEEAIKSYKKAEVIQLKLNANSDLENTYNSLGIIYAMKMDYEPALVYFNKSLKLSLADNYSFGVALSNYNIGAVLVEQDHYRQGLSHFQTAYEIQKNNNFTAELINTLAALSYAHSYIGESELSKAFLEEAEQLNTSFNAGEQSFHEAYYKHYKLKKNFKEALSQYEEYTSLKDSIFNKENQNIITGLRLKYDSEKKDKEIAEQNLQLVENEQEIQKRKTQYSYMTGAVLLLLVGLTSLWFIYQQRQKRKNQEIISLKREQQVQTLESLMEGEEKERIRISKELHDGVNVDLSAIKYKLTSMLEKNNEVINEVVTMIDKSCEQVRAISHNLVPPSLKDFSVIETIEDFCTTTNSIHDPEITFSHIGDAITISKKAEVNIFRIVQELVNNSIKHAEATEINVQISKHNNNNIQLTIEDNGKGFVKGEIESNGIGLKNIQSRVDYLSAKLDFSSNDNGTSYIIDINTESLS